MKITGYQLREALRHWRSVLEGLAIDLKGSLYYFDIKEKIDPLIIAEDYKTAEDAVSRIEEAQQRYNLRINLTIADEPQTLTYAIKALGMAGRYAAIWKAVASDKQSKRGWDDSYDRVRNKDDVHAKRTISKETASKMRTAANRYAADIRQAIALANASNIEIDIPENLINFGR